MNNEGKVGPINEPPAELVEDTSTKSIRVPVVNPPLPEPIMVADLPIEATLIPKRKHRKRKKHRTTWVERTPLPIEEYDLPDEEE